MWHAMKKVRQGMLVFPGDKLGVEEEYFPGQGVYIDSNGYIRSQVVGRVLIDIIKRIINVKNVHGKPFVPKIGDIIEGIASSVSDDLAFIDIYAIEEKPSRSTDFTGVLHISQVSAEYIETMHDAMRLGDVIRARIINSNHPFQLTTKEPSLGVIIAFCTRCGSIMRKQDDKLICPVCGNIEKRKVSTSYIFR